MLEDSGNAVFTKWLERHSASVIKVARAYTLQSEDCQDLAQEILLQAWRSLPRFKGQSSPAAAGGVRRLEGRMAPVGEG